MGSVNIKKLLWLSGLLLCILHHDSIDARKSSNRRVTSSGRVTKPTQHHTQNSDLVKLSYGGTQSAPHPPKPADHAPHPPAPSAPVAPHSEPAKPVGWNVPHNEPVQSHHQTSLNSAPPHSTGQQQFGSPPYPVHNNAAPPPYSPQAAPYPTQNNGPPPPYSPHGAPVQPQYNAAPPPYSPVNPGGHQPAPGGYPNGYQNVPQNGYPNQGYPGGYPGGQQPVINYHEAPKSGGGSGLTNALLVGVGGLSLYSALKPGEEKTVIEHHYHNGTEVTNSTQAPGAAAPTTLPPGAPVNATTPVPLAPIVPPECLPANCTGEACNATTVNPLCLTTPVPAVTPSAVTDATTTLAPNATPTVNPSIGVPLAPLVSSPAPDASGNVPLAPLVPVPVQPTPEVAKLSPQVLSSANEPPKQQTSGANQFSLSLITILAAYLVSLY